MRLNRFIGNFDFSEDSLYLTHEISHQVRNVLKMKIGETMILGDGNCNEVVARIGAMEKEGVRIIIVKRRPNTSEPRIHTTLYCAILKKENFEWVAEKTTEIGVKEIVPVRTQRTIKTDINRARLKKIIKEAAEQSGRGILPVLKTPMKFEEAVADSLARNDESRFFSLQAARVAENRTKEKSGSHIGIFIGPEGGWSEEEEGTAHKRGLLFQSLGSLTLRAETAAILASFLTLWE